MPEDIARHMIDGFIGPGPFAQDPIKLGPIGKITDETFDENDITGYGFGCHKCGTLEPGTDNGHFILDHQLPKGVNFGNWTFSFYPHCESCMWQQGGHVRVVRRRLKREGFIP